MKQAHADLDIEGLPTSKASRAIRRSASENHRDVGNEPPRDGDRRLKTRGPAIARAYFKEDAPILDAEGFFDTGDVATIDGHSYMQITDRSKDVIKSGGEWISSIELENLAVGHPKVAEAAVIGVKHPKWDERPLLIVVLKKDQTAGKDDILGFMRGRTANWWMPDDVVFVDEIPHTATGKILKTELWKARYDFVLPNSVPQCRCVVSGEVLALPPWRRYRGVVQSHPVAEASPANPAPASEMDFGAVKARRR
jgi:acyl-CoA synthetase (AMP-forming)/AMP-acid ligase II